MLEKRGKSLCRWSGEDQVGDEVKEVTGSDGAGPRGLLGRLEPPPPEGWKALAGLQRLSDKV